MFRALVRPGGPCCAVGGGPPASPPRREPSARRVVSKPGQAPPPPTGTAAWPSNPSHTLYAGDCGGFALHEAFWRHLAGVSNPRVATFPPSRGLPGGRGAQNADYLVQNTPNPPIFTEVVCVLGAPVSGSGVVFAREQRHRPSEAMSHVIPRRLLHRLNYHHWNCNVCRLSQKVTALNYVRLLEEATPDICHGTTCIKGHFRHH